MVCVLTARELRSVQRLASSLESRGMSAEAEMLRAILRVAGERAEVKASVAAEVFRVSPQTIRNWVKSGVVAGRIDSTGHVFVSLDAVKSAFEMEAAMPYQPESTPELTMDEIQAMVDEVRAQKREERRRVTRAS
jgi:hypothetical protein